jgi:hypothetical protein
VDPGLLDPSPVLRLALDVWQSTYRSARRRSLPHGGKFLHYTDYNSGRTLRRGQSGTRSTVSLSKRSSARMTLPTWAIPFLQLSFHFGHVSVPVLNFVAEEIIDLSLVDFNHCS